MTPEIASILYDNLSLMIEIRVDPTTMISIIRFADLNENLAFALFNASLISLTSSRISETFNIFYIFYFKYNTL